MLAVVLTGGAHAPEAAVALRWAVPTAIVALIAALAVIAGMTWRLMAAHRRHRAAEQRAYDATATLKQALAAHTAMDGDLQRAKEVAETANAAKTRYLVAVSHEIRSPLNAIYGYGQLLERGGAISAPEAGGVIRRSAEHLTNLVEGLLEISRIESGVVKLRTDVIELPALVDHVVDMFRMQAQSKGLDLRCQINGHLPRFVRADEKRLRQILINLLSNAIKYTDQGSVTLAITYRSQVADVAITDTGIGIATQDLERIFEPFERGSLPEAALQPGIGLGLAITRVLARILGGEIDVTSTPGTGSRFRLRIFLPEPFAPPDAAAQYNRVIGYRGPRRTVLLVDDDQSQISVLDSLLRQLGFIVYAACNGSEGLTLAERCDPDLVLLDVQMPGISGWETAARLRGAYAGAIRIVMVSANVQEVRAGGDVGADALDTGGVGDDTGGDGGADHDAYVSKPVDLDALLTVIGRELKLEWEVAGDRAAPADPPMLPPLPPGAGELVQQIRDLAKVGHIRALETALAQLESSVPESAAAVATMRNYSRTFDLRSVIKLLDGIQPH